MTSATDVRTLLEQNGLPVHEPMRLKTEGIVHSVWRCGDVLVRVLKDEEYREDVLTEADVAPIAWAAGVPMAEPLTLRPDADPPYSVFRWVEGNRLSDRTVMRDPHRFFWRFGAALARLHAMGEGLPDLPSLDSGWTVEWDLVAVAIRRWPRSERRWADVLADEFAWLGLPWTRFAHQDLHGDNVLVTPEEAPIFVDWGDAGLGDGACDFRFVPARFLESTFSGYGGVSRPFRGAVALHQVAQRAYAEHTGVRYGPFGETSFGELKHWVQSWL